VPCPIISRLIITVIINPRKAQRQARTRSGHCVEEGAGRKLESHSGILRRTENTYSRMGVAASNKDA